MSRLATRRRRAAGQVMIFVGLLALAWALVSPRLRARDRHRFVNDAIGAVAATRAALVAFESEHGVFPPDGPPGVVPDELLPFLDGVLFAPGAYTLDVQRWSRLIRPDPPPNFDPQDTVPPPEPYVRYTGGLTVHSADTLLLASLLTGFGRTNSFVYDTSWTLVIGPADEGR